MYILWLNVNNVITRWRWLDKQKTTQASIAYFSFIVDQTFVSRPEPWSWNHDSKPSFLPTTFIVQVLKSKKYNLIYPNTHPFLGLSNSKRMFFVQENYSDINFTAWNGYCFEIDFWIWSQKCVAAGNGINRKKLM